MHCTHSLAVQIWWREHPTTCFHLFLYLLWSCTQLHPINRSQCRCLWATESTSPQLLICRGLTHRYIRWALPFPTDKSYIIVNDLLVVHSFIPVSVSSNSHNTIAHQRRPVTDTCTSRPFHHYLPSHLLLSAHQICLYDDVYQSGLHNR